ncbi:hypothetical protein NLU13_6914 [Sarocladium strictum]|uniref:Uncharacterized protein n=1 Tax=Sarocladium strictum TaxID=5046 RepID=A0AA39GGM0_SARSR|nr:hypothetical protein NLU13_6914 [Sarocladium strictum]
MEANPPSIDKASTTTEVLPTTGAKDPTANLDACAFQCGICKQQYKRADHLARHVRSHYRHKPHKCPKCDKAFSRTDLLNRHITGHNRDHDTQGNPIRGTQSRVSKACKSCAVNHLRCTESKPCKRCDKKGLECIWDDQASVSGSQQGSPPSPKTLSHTATNERDSDLTTDTSAYSNAPPLLTPQSQNHPDACMNRTPFPAHAQHISTPPIQHARSEYGVNPEAGPHFPIPNGTSTPRFPDWNFLPGCQTPAEHDVDFGAWSIPDFQLDEAELQFLQVYNHAVPFELGGGSQSETSYGIAPKGPDTIPAGTSPEARHLASSGREAFRRRHWRFQPSARDRAGAEEHNLSLSLNLQEQTSAESRVSVHAHVTAARLDATTRDKILTIVVKNCHSENLTRALQCFPSVALLDKLLQYYLTSPLAMADSWIHVPTFDPNTKRPELLLAIAAAGAVLTSDVALTKLGYAMQEVVRPAVGNAWESDNTLTRDLELLQAFLIYLEMGVWSGHSRKIEITESFLQAPLTMLRRSGKFKSTGYSAAWSPLSLLDGDPNLSGPMLEAEWRSWTHDESYKRTAFRLLAHDTNSSMCLVVNPLLSYAEISLPLPCAPTFWSATNCERWKSALLSAQSHIETHGMQPHPETVAQLADEPGLYLNASATVPVPSFDITLANKAFVSYAWGLCWEYTQLANLCRSRATNEASLHARNPGRWSSLILSSRKDELTKLLQQFRIASYSYQNHDIPGASAESALHGPQGTTFLCMRLEHILLHMHAPIEAIQIFAGMEGPEQAAEAHSIVVDWVSSETARSAVWHSGQIVSAAKKVPHASIQGPLAFSLYHASLVLWTYALVWLGDHLSSPHRPSNSASNPVYIDDDGMTMTTQRFLQLGAGRPCFRASLCAPPSLGRTTDTEGQGEDEVFLEEPDKVMRALVDVLYANYRGSRKPNLIERLIQLMEALQRSPRATGDRISEGRMSA